MQLHAVQLLSQESNCCHKTIVLTLVHVLLVGWYSPTVWGNSS